MSRKPYRQYLEDLYGLQEALQRQLERTTRPAKTKLGIERVMLTSRQRQHLEDLLKQCRQEIKRVEAAIGGRRARGTRDDEG
jgi:hypothetical protein